MYLKQGQKYEFAELTKDWEFWSIYHGIKFNLLKKDMLKSE